MTTKPSHTLSRNTDPRLDPKLLLKIGEVAALLGVTSRTLRFYEELGLLMPARTAKGTRLYGPDDIEAARIACALTDLGIPLQAIQALATARSQSQTGDQASRTVSNLLEALRVSVEQRRKDCDIMLNQIAAATSLVRQCFGCPKTPTYTGCQGCPVSQHLDHSPVLRIIWDKVGQSHKSPGDNICRLLVK